MSRCVSCPSNPPDGSTRLSDTQKRKLPEAAWSGADPKRHKDNDAQSDTASVAATDGDSSSGDDRDSASDTPTANPGHTVDGPGPYVFYCWADGIYTLVEASEMESVYFALKAACIETWANVAHLPKEERYGALGEHIHMVTRWYAHVPDGATDTPQATMLKAEWETINAEERAGSNAGDDQDEDDEPGWWYEVDAQREKPDEGLPALQVELEGEGAWWVTGFRGADLEGRRAMADLVDYLSVDN